MKLRFGTDGVRARAFDELTVGDAVAIAKAATEVLQPTRAVIAHDSRESGEAFCAGLAAGFAEVGVAVEFLGIAPTPAVAFLAATAADDAETIGVMVSASHNPWHDNGIKIFASGGRKLTDDQQVRVEAILGTEASPEVDIPVASLGEVEAAEHRVGEYTHYLHRTVPADQLAGLKIVVDAANGAASHVVAPVFADLGADVVLLASEPNGRNINDECGSTHPAALSAAVIEHEADFGLALDGDADRLVAVDHAGEIVDGDHIIAICAIDMAARGELAEDTVVITVMTNLGFRLAMAERSITVVETPVGDRHVLESLEANGWSLGGEQSGHVIFRRIASTGDGMLCGLQLASIVARSGETLANLASASMSRLPQVLENVTVRERVPNVAELLADDIASVEAGLGDAGRVLVRASGTEPVIRVMVEAPTEEIAQRSCRVLVERAQAMFGTAPTD